MWLARATGLAATVAYLPHQLYHQNHLDLLPDATDRVLQTVTLSLVSVAAVVLTVLAFRLPSPRTGDAAGRAPDAVTGSRR